MWKKLFGKKGKNRHFITIVSGLPRSGTSMMMHILQAGGMEIIVDHIRKADEDNPKSIQSNLHVITRSPKTSYIQDWSV